jgi:hypothetical protein
MNQQLPARLGPDDLQRAADEAERGYDVEWLAPRRSVGRPLEVGASPATVIPVRLDSARVHRLDELAKARNTSRSQLIREAIDQALATSPT